MSVSETMLRNCVWGVNCEKQWDDLEQTTFETVRHCGACNSPVHFCEDDEQLAYAIKQNWCVSFTVKDEKLPSRITVFNTGFIESIRSETFTDIARNNPAFKVPSKGYAKAWADQSPLFLLGYRVGRKGSSVRKRRELLEAFFHVTLPMEFPPNYAERWGAPGTEARKVAMVEHIRWLAAQASQRENADSMAVAITDWEQDAAFVEAANW